VYAYLCIGCESRCQCLCVLGGVINARVCSCAYVCVCMCVCTYIYVHFFAVGVVCTLEQVFWALVHCFWQASDSVCTTVLTACWTVHRKLENDLLETSNKQINVIDLTMRTLVMHTNTHTLTHKHTRTTHDARTCTLMPNKSVALSASACQVSLH